MDGDRHIWRLWADSLHRWGVLDAAASLLEACGPLTMLGAQALYLGQPLLRGFLSNSQLTALADLLENTNETEAFVNYLREAKQA